MEYKTAHSQSNPFTHKRMEAENLDRIALRPAEAAVAIGISIRKLHDLLKSGEIKYAKLDRAVLIPVSSLEDFIESKIVPAAEQPPSS